MNWWYATAIPPILYLSVSLGPWFVLQITQRLAVRRLRSLDTMQERLQSIRESLTQYEARWPSEARPGRYSQPDRCGRECIHALVAATEEILQRWPTLSFYAPVKVSVAGVFRFGAWRPLLETLAVSRDAARIQELLDQGDEDLAVIREQERSPRAYLNGRSLT